MRSEAASTFSWSHQAAAGELLSELEETRGQSEHLEAPQVLPVAHGVVARDSHAIGMDLLTFAFAVTAVRVADC